jgi:hypothetical protein
VLVLYTEPQFPNKFGEKCGSVTVRNFVCFPLGNDAITLTKPFLVLGAVALAESEKIQ